MHITYILLIFDKTFLIMEKKAKNKQLFNILYLAEITGISYARLKRVNISKEDVSKIRNAINQEQKKYCQALELMAK